MATVSDIIQELGSDAIQAACGVGEYSVRAAKRDGRFPASWFDAIDKECARAGVKCPRELFSFKRSDDSGEAA